MVREAVELATHLVLHPPGAASRSAKGVAMQIKKNTRENRYGMPEQRYNESVIPVGLEEEPQADTSTMEYSTMPDEATQQPEPMTITRNREGNAYAPAAVNESVIDGNSTFEGKFETDQDLRILGSIGGEVICRGRLTIEKDAVARAKLQARDATIRGRIDGDMICSGRLDLASTAVIHGTIKAGMLTVEEGATVQGSVEVGNSPAITQNRTTTTARKGDNGNAANAAAEEETPLPSLSSARASRRDTPSFALVSSDDRLAP